MTGSHRFRLSITEPGQTTVHTYTDHLPAAVTRYCRAVQRARMTGSTITLSESIRPTSDSLPITVPWTTFATYERKTNHAP